MAAHNGSMSEARKSFLRNRYAENKAAIRGYQNQLYRNRSSEENSRRRRIKYEKQRANQISLAPYPPPNICEICGKSGETLHFDHDHITGWFRGWLCLRCNLTLGNVQDDVELLERMISYLQAL